jgi:hypothetical protein
VSAALPRPPAAAAGSCRVHTHTHQYMIMGDACYLCLGGCVLFLSLPRSLDTRGRGGPCYSCVRAWGAVSAEEGSLEDVLALKQEMAAHGPPLSTLVYATVLAAVYAATHDVNTVLAQWDDMCQVRTALSLSLSVLVRVCLGIDMCLCLA